MAMDIRNERDVREAYEIINSLTWFVDQCDNPKKAAHMMDDIKQKIRAYNRAQAAKRTDTLVKDYGSDGFIVRFEMPEVTDPEAWFDDNERLICRPSQYDCTGQAFTIWHKICRLNGKLTCYHRVGFDV